MSIEPENDSQLPITVTGVEAIRQKEEQYNQLIEARHSGFCKEPIVATYHFACAMGMDVTIKGKGRKVKEQIGIFEVENGKIVKEQFFYNDFE